MSKSEATISGQAIVSTIETLSALGPIGDSVLQEHGITTIDPGGRYSFQIRRAIHDAILNRFGEIAIYAFGFNNFWAYPDFVAKQEIYKKDCKGITNVKNIKQAQKSLIKFLTLVTRDIDAGFKSGVKNGSGTYGAELVIQGPEQFQMAVTTTSSLSQEAFMRGTLEILVLTHLAEAWEVEIKYLKEKSQEGPDWAKAAYFLDFKMLKNKGSSHIAPRKQRDVDNKLLEAVLTESEIQKKQLEDLSRHLGKYIPPQIHRALFTGQYGTEIATRRKKLTIFFSDIKNFTSTSEGLQPEDLTKYLNEYFSEMTKIALELGGTIDKYIGDAMMVFFGDPESRGEREDARACVEMALVMQDRMKQLQEKWKNQGFAEPFQVRMGINTGYCNVGNFGSDQRLTYTIIGAEVNVAQRLEANAEANGILISYEAYAHSQDMIKVEELEPIKMKGVSREIKLFAVKARSISKNDRFVRAEKVEGEDDGTINPSRIDVRMDLLEEKVNSLAKIISKARLDEL